MDARADARRVWLLGGLLLLVTLLAFGQAVGHEFVNWDDLDAVANNPDYNPPRLDKLVGYWTQPVAKFYVPVLWTVWGLLAFLAQEPAATGSGTVLTPGVYHAFNVACHLVASLLAYRILRRLTRSDWAAFAGALLFAVHPLQVEAVVWVSGMKTPLSGVFALLAVWHYLRFSDLLPGSGEVAAGDAGVGSAGVGADSPPTAARAWAHYAAATAAYVLALLTKPTIILLPLIIAAIDVLLRRRDWRSARRLWLPLGAWTALAAVAAVITKQAQPGILVYHPSLAVRPLVAADAVAFYLYKLALPLRLIPDYGRTPRWLIEQGPLYLTWMAPAAVLVLCLLFLRRAPWLAVGGVIFVVGMLPSIGLTPFDYQLFSTVADRYAYFSLFGPALVLAYALAELRRPSWRAIAPTAVALSALAVISFVQTGYWRDSATLFRRTLEVNPTSLVAHRVFGYDAVARGRPDEAERHYLAALQTAPEDGLTHYNLGNVLARQNRLEEAVARYRAGLACPMDPGVRRDSHVNLGIALARTGKLVEAFAAFEEALRLDPANETARTNRARLLSRYPNLRPATNPAPAGTHPS